MDDNPPVMVETGREGEPVVVKIAEFHGRKRLDIRHHWSPESPGGLLAPTKKGISIPLEYAEELYLALQHVLVEAGVIDG